MSNEASMPRQVIVFYQEDKHYRLLAATGVHGGPIPSGDILADFFIERKTPPEKLILEIEGSTPKEIKREGGKFIREIQVGILLRPDIAHNIGKWLIEKAAQAGFTEIKQ